MSTGSIKEHRSGATGHENENEGADAAPRQRPNVVMIVLDDLGFADIGAFGSAIDTPNIDALAAQGLRYNNFHVTAVCSASRASFLTGRNHHRVGMGFLTVPSGAGSGYSARIPRSAGTLPRVLRDNGYNTLAVGKWHLTPAGEDTAAGPYTHWPLGMGFERYYGFLSGRSNQWAPDLVRDNSRIDVDLEDADGNEYHLTEDLTTQAIRFVQEQQEAAPGKPFFLYFATGAMHFPHQVPAEWVEAYRGKFDDGWSALREATLARQVQEGVVPSGTVASERPSWVPEWETLPPEARALFSRMMEVYAGFLSHTDAQIGRLIDFLRELNILDNTLVLVVSDNGASADGGPHGAVGLEGYFKENDISAMLGHIDTLGSRKSYNHYAWGWAWASNTPFRLWKHYTWLGGVRVPLIVRWPGGIADGEVGGVRGQFGHAIDLMPTILDAAGVSVPSAIDGVDQDALDGASLLPTFGATGCPSPRSTQYFEMMGSRAIYHDGWKATTNHVANFPAQRELVEGSRDTDSDKWSLFHVAEDFAEAQDVAEANPHELRRLIELWWHEAGRNGVLPIMDGFAGRIPTMTSVNSQSTSAASRVYRPGGTAVSIPPLTAGFRISADLELPDSVVPEGVICAQGDWNAGWACLVLDGDLTVIFAFGPEPTRLVVPGVLTPGEHVVEVAYAIQDPCALSLTVDGRVVASEHLQPIAKDLIATGGMLVGRDRGLPVSDDYRPPFRFNGTLRKVTVTSGS